VTMQPEQGISHELGLGEVISKTFEVYRRDFAKYFVLFAVVGVIIQVVTVLAQQAFVLPTLPVNPTPQQFSAYFSALFGALFLLLVVIFVVNIVFSTIAESSAIRLIALLIFSALTAPLGFIGPVVNGILSALYQPLFPILMAVYYYSNLARISQPPPGQMPMGSTTPFQLGMNLCPTCGTQNSSSAAFCTKCGARLS